MGKNPMAHNNEVCENGTTKYSRWVDQYEADCAEEERRRLERLLRKKKIHVEVEVENPAPRNQCWQPLPETPDSFLPNYGKSDDCKDVWRKYHPVKPQVGDLRRNSRGHVLLNQSDQKDDSWRGIGKI